MVAIILSGANVICYQNFSWLKMEQKSSHVAITSTSFWVLIGELNYDKYWNSFLLVSVYMTSIKILQTSETSHDGKTILYHLVLVKYKILGNMKSFSQKLHSWFF